MKIHTFTGDCGAGRETRDRQPGGLSRGTPSADADANPKFFAERRVVPAAFWRLLLLIWLAAFGAVNAADNNLALNLNRFGPTGLQWVTLPRTNLFDFTSQFSAEFWVSFNEWPTTTIGLVSKSSTAWSVNLLPSGKIGFMTAGLTNPVTGDTNLLSSTPLERSTLGRTNWYHVAVTYDPILREKSIYLNGAKDSAASSLEGALMKNAVPVLFGADPDFTFNVVITNKTITKDYTVTNTELSALMLGDVATVSNLFIATNKTASATNILSVFTTIDNVKSKVVLTNRTITANLTSTNPISNTTAVLASAGTSANRFSVTNINDGVTNILAVSAETSVVGAPGSLFQGAIDEVRIWRAVRSEEQIREAYSRRLNGSEPGLLGVWSFESDSGTTVKAGELGSGLNGAFNGLLTPGEQAPGPALLAPASPQFAFAFNGFSDFLTVSRALPLGDQATFEAWVKPSSQFIATDLLDLQNLINTLNGQTGWQAPLSKLIWEQFSINSRALLNNSGADTLTKNAKTNALLAELNRIIQGPSIYQADRFATTPSPLRDETQTMLQSGVSGSDVMRLNRLLLEDAYPPLRKLNTQFLGILAKGVPGYGLVLGGDRSLRFHYGNTDWNAASQGPQDIPFDQWSRLAVVFQRPVHDGNADITFFVNGLPVRTNSSVVIPSTLNNSEALRIGRAGNGNYFRGEMDEVRIWNTVRTPTELSLFAARDVPITANGLVDYWKFNEGSGKTVKDAIASSRDGTLAGDSGWTDGQVVAAPIGDLSNLQPDPASKGLWIGQVTLTKVNEVHAKNLNDSTTPRDVPDAAKGSFRILLHVDESGQVRLLKDVTIMGTRADAAGPIRPVLVTDPSLIPTFDGVVMRGGKRVALRHGSAAFDFAGNELPMAGGVGADKSCLGKITLPADHPTNPFRHRYHPEHRGGYDITREISIQFRNDLADSGLDHPANGVDRLTGVYRETVTGLHKIPIKVYGTLSIDRISTNSVLNRAVAN